MTITLRAIAIASLTVLSSRALAQAPATEDVPVPGGTVAMARELEIAAPDRARFLVELVHALYEAPAGGVETGAARLARFTAYAGAGKHAARRPEPRAGGGADPLESDSVPVPLGSRLWSDAIFHRRVDASMLFASIVADRRAALLAVGLAALDDETLRYIAGNTALLQRLYDEHAASFAAFGEALRIRDGRVVPPGGADALPLWEAALDANASAPDRFVRELLGAAHGRVALVYAALTHLDAPHVRFATGTWMPDARSRVDQFKALIAASARRTDWDVNRSPFARPVHDVALMLARVRVDPDGRPAAPFARAFWRRAFESVDLPDDPARLLRSPQDDGVVDAGWLAENVCGDDVRTRGERLDQLSFAQRAFAAAGAAELPDVLVAVRALPRFRMLMLTLERMGVRDPRLYAAAARHAAQLAPLDGRRAFVAFGQFQGALAVLARLERVHRVPPRTLDALAASLVSTPFSGAYGGGIARWIDRDLRSALEWPAGADVDDELVRALAGVEIAPESQPRIEWEGRTYRIDFAAPERSRLTRARQKMASPSVGAAVELSAAAATIGSPSVSASRLREAIAILQRLAAALPASDKKTVVAPPFVEPPPDAAGVVERAIAELTKTAGPIVPRDAARVGDQLSALGDDLLAQALLSLAYVMDVGDPEGTTLLGGDPSRRHDFGIAAGTTGARIRAAWSTPREITDAGARHVGGSLVGLDVALSELALRRVNVSSLPPAPTLTMPDHTTFVVTLMLMRPLDLTDADRDALVAAIRRGRARLAALQHDEAGWDAAADQLGVDGWRRRAGRWAILHDADALPSFVSLVELARLGSPTRDPALDPWGMSGLAGDGCLCTIGPARDRVAVIAGRPQLGLLATQMADLNLRVAERLEAARLPASLAQAVLAAALQDFIERTHPVHANDWLTLVRAAQAVSDDRIDDYVASMTAGGPLVLDRPPSDAEGRTR